MKSRMSLVLVIAFIIAALSGCRNMETNSETGSTQANMSAEISSDEPKADNAGIVDIGDDYPMTIRDHLGVETVLESKPARVAVLSATPLNIWYDLGGKSICSSDVSDNVRLTEGYEQEIRALPPVGQVYAVNIEAVVEQEPDLIIAQSGVQSTVASALSEMGFKVIQTSIRSFDDVIDTYRVFGKLLGVSELAEERIASFVQGKNDIVDKLPEDDITIVIIYVTSRSIAVKLDNSIAGDITSILELNNIASELPPDTIGSETTPLDIEYIVQQNPDYVLVTTMISSNEEARKTVEEQFASNPAWSSVKAIAEGKVIYLPQQYYLYNAGPYYLDAIQYMASSIYPEIYGAID
jgi:iron complex transport system substrate-binding protein